MGWATSAVTSSSPALLAKGVPSGSDPRPAAALAPSPVPSRGEPAQDSNKEGGEEEEEEGRVVSEALIKAEEDVRCTVETTLQELQDGGQKNGPGGGMYGLLEAARKPSVFTTYNPRPSSSSHTFSLISLSTHQARGTHRMSSTLGGSSVAVAVMLRAT